MTHQLKTLALAVVAGATLSTAALADREEVRLLPETKVTLVQAIETAQKHVGGQAYDASLDDDSFNTAYEVNVAKDGKTIEVHIDGKTGKVLGAREDLDD